VVKKEAIMLSVLIILFMVVLLVTLFVGRLSEIVIAKIRQKQLDRSKLTGLTKQ
jgi:hypothetical protein